MIAFAEIQAYCLAKPGTVMYHPFGPFPICFKVCSRIYLEWYPDEEKVTLRCEPMLADYYRRSYPGAVIVGYHCPDRQKPFKNTVYLNQGMEDELIYEMLDHSYDEAVKRLKKRERNGLNTDNMNEE